MLVAIIVEFANDAYHVHLQASLTKLLARMITRLSILWEFKEHGDLYGYLDSSHLLFCAFFGLLLNCCW